MGAASKPFRLAVHGGAWNIPDALWKDHRRGCAAAYREGIKVLDTGGTAVDAVATAIRTLEDDPTFDAGYGSFLNQNGQVELDAGLMEGGALQSGAIVGVSRVKNPIDLARHILLYSPHCVFAGEGAHRQAEAAGFPAVDPEIHIHERERAVFARIQAGETELLDKAWTHTPLDTVGAVALDVHGNLAAGNSTGGTLNKASGRIGDAPLMGLGFYADNELGAFVCTGWGESIMRSAMGMSALRMLPELGPEKSAEAAIQYLRRRVGGYGGIILMTPDGAVGVAHNTERMAYHLDPEAEMSDTE